MNLFGWNDSSEDIKKFLDTHAEGWEKKEDFKIPSEGWNNTIINYFGSERKVEEFYNNNEELINQMYKFQQVNKDKNKKIASSKITYVVFIIRLIILLVCINLFLWLFISNYTILFLTLVNAIFLYLIVSWVRDRYIIK